MVTNLEKKFQDKIEIIQKGLIQRFENAISLNVQIQEQNKENNQKLNE